MSSDLPIGPGSSPFVDPHGPPGSSTTAHARAERFAEVLRVKTLARLAAGLVHDLKNPLAVVSLGLAFLRARPVEGIELDEVLADMGDAVGHATAAMTELLELATPHRTAPRRIPLEAALGHALALARPQRCCAGVVFAEGQRKGPTDVLADVSSATQVLVNALLDVAEETAPGGTVRLRTFGLQQRAPAGGEPSPARRSWVVCDVDSLTPAEGLDPRRPLATRAALDGARRLLLQQGGWLRASRRRGGGARVTVAYPAAE